MKYLDKSTHQLGLTKERFEDAGLDIRSNEDCIIFEEGSKLIGTGIYLEIPTGYVGILKSRSGLSVKYSIEVGAGVVDSLYRGQVFVHLYNHGLRPFEVRVGDRIAQLLTFKVELEEYEKVLFLSETDRGEKGFGSSGIQ